MRLNDMVRGAIERRLGRVERALKAIEGISVERIGDGLRLSGRGLIRRSIEDVRLRFAGRGR